MNRDEGSQCEGTATVQCVLISPHGGVCIYGKPGEPMERVTPVADAAGWTGGVTMPRTCGTLRTWRCGHIHETRDGALACAAGFSRRCPKCEGILNDDGHCGGNMILGSCGWQLPSVIDDIMWAQERADATVQMYEELRALAAGWADAMPGDAAASADARFDCAAQLEKVLMGGNDGVHDSGGGSDGGMERPEARPGMVGRD